MSKIVSIQSDAGMVTVYDPTLVRERIKSASTWWKASPLNTPERNDGRVAVWPVGYGREATRPYRLRIGEGLTEAETPFACGASEPATIRIEGEEVFVGPIERLPGDGAGDRLPTLPEGGGLYPAPEPGTYELVVHVLNWKNEERFWNEDNEPTGDAPPDFVVVIAPADGLTRPVEPKPLLEYLPKKTPLASKKVTHATRPPPAPLEPEKKKRARATTKKAPSKTPLQQRQQKVLVRALKPGELGVGAKVRHAVYGVGEIRFMRDGFPKVKVSFSAHGDHKVDKSELTVL